MDEAADEGGGLGGRERGEEGGLVSKCKSNHISYAIRDSFLDHQGRPHGETTIATTTTHLIGVHGNIQLPRENAIDCLVQANAGRARGGHKVIAQKVAGSSGDDQDGMDEGSCALGQDGSADGQGGRTRTGGRAAAGCVASPSTASLGLIHELVEDEGEAGGQDEAASRNDCHGPPSLVLHGVDGGLREEGQGKRGRLTTS